MESKSTEVVHITCAEGDQRKWVDHFKELRAVVSGKVLLPGLVVFAQNRERATRKLADQHNLHYPVVMTLDINLGDADHLQVVVTCAQ